MGSQLEAHEASTGKSPSSSEQVLTGIWQELLGRDDVGADQNFFELGGHSILAVRMVSILRKRHGIEVPVRLVFRRPTISALARFISVSHEVGAL